MSTELFSTLPYKVADITLAEFGRQEIDMAEKEMILFMSPIVILQHLMEMMEMIRTIYMVVPIQL